MGRSEKEELTDEVADIESLVVGPESVVNARVPSTVGANYVVGGGDGSDEEQQGTYEELQCL